jgi:nitrate reductase gamma subunit
MTMVGIAGVALLLAAGSFVLRRQVQARTMELTRK